MSDNQNNLQLNNDASMKKGLFIGLGGSGLISLAHLKYKMFKNYYNGDETLFNQNNSFIFLDTDQKDRNVINKHYFFKLNNREIIEDKYFINLGYTNPHNIYYSILGKSNKISNDKRFLEWMDPNAVKILPNNNLEHGAGGVRMEGRTAVYDNYDKITSKMNTAFQQLFAVGNVDTNNLDFTIWVLSGSCGGTGSSALMDILFTVELEYKKFFGIRAGSPPVRQIIYMPFGYTKVYNEATNRERYYPNGYAFMKEINLFLKDRYFSDRIDSLFEKFFCKDEILGRKFSMFKYAIPLDAQTEHGKTMKLKELYVNAAEMIYYTHVGAAGNSMLSQLINIIDQYYKRDPEWIRAFMPMGYRALKGSEEYFKQYIKTRLIYELFEFGLSGEKFEKVITSINEQDKFRDNIIFSSIYKYIFSDYSGTEPLNLDKITGKPFYDIYKDRLTDDQFKDEKGRKLVKDKISDKSLLTDWKKTLDQDIVSMKKSMQEEYKRNVNDIQAKVIENISSIVEECILKYGTNFVKELIIRIDNYCENEIKSKKFNFDNIAQKIREGEQNTVTLINACIMDKGKSFNNYYKQLEDLLLNYFKLETEFYHLSFLKWLSEGEDGWLDNLKRFIDEFLSRVLTEKLKYSTNYFSELIKTFNQTADDVTTTLLPDVSKFSDQNGWISDNKFSKLYERVFKQVKEPVSGNKIPIRNGKGDLREGIHQFLYDMLSNPTATQRNPSGYYNPIINNIRFFTYSLNDGDITAEQVFEDFQKILQRYIDEILLLQNSDLSSEINKSITDRYNQLSTDEKKYIKVKFNDENTHIFCPLNFSASSDAHETYYVYAGLDPVIAEQLGYNKNDTIRSQFVPDNHLNAIYKIKYYVGVNLLEYGFIDQYKKSYYDLKEKRPDLFYPHIHQLLNQIDDLDNLLDTSLRQENTFVELMLLNEFFKIIENDKKYIKFKNDIFSSLDKKGVDKPVSSPINIMTQNNKLIIKFIKDFDADTNTDENGKIYIKYGQMEDVYSSAKDDLFECYNRIKGRLVPLSKTSIEFQKCFMTYFDNDKKIRIHSEILDKANIKLKNTISNYVKKNKTNKDKVGLLNTFYNLIDEVNNNIFSKQGL